MVEAAEACTDDGGLKLGATPSTEECAFTPPGESGGKRPSAFASGDTEPDEGRNLHTGLEFLRAAKQPGDEWPP